jgi:hypothetical protein
MSDLTADLLNGLVAAGTLALAGATVYLGRATRNAALDSTLPRVVVAELAIDPSVRQQPRVAGEHPPPIDPSRWGMTQHGDDLIGLRAVARLRNEGDSSAWLQVTHANGMQIDTSTLPRLERQDGRYVLPPHFGQNVDLLLTWWQPIRKWSVTAGEVPATTVQLVVHSASRLARDECTLTIGAVLVKRLPVRDGWLLTAGNDDSLPVVVANVGIMRRTYRRRRVPG